MKTQRGVLLLPVALTLAVVAALAYTMTREGGMNVSAVDAQYDIEVARYLAASGMQVAKWRGSVDDCDDDEAGYGTLRLPGGSVTVSSAKENKGILTVSLTATTERKSVMALTRAMQMIDLDNPKAATIIGPGDADTTIVKGGSASLANADTLTATEGSAHPLLLFKLTPELDRASIIQADLKLTKKSGNNSQPGRLLSAHRITREWNKNATWTSPRGDATVWTTAGGDYVETPAASVVIDPGSGAYNGVYTLRIDTLAQAWANSPPANYGLLLKPTALSNVPFISFDGSSKPELSLRYYKRCT
ncbi:DNRLRE domain-containing protein [Massilia sp. YIM B02769]|uniref:DNRLRE domain-containing protein n=1 Tax=Massilia sp. YIM B02769 TaxID=3050129 RepID=UPI0025B6A594|nr:DNRLRE domain-containing protein [Massilia sp. YIM B02769]MDN4056818.1 DNRLRE domain-containing protein [Massilia sp. YIM B02769]